MGFLSCWGSCKSIRWEKRDGSVVLPLSLAACVVSLIRVHRTFDAPNTTTTVDERSRRNTARDEELVASALNGGPDAFGLIVHRYQHAVYAVALSRLHSFAEAQDVAQQVFVEAYQKLAKLRDPGRLGAWLRAAATKRSIDAIRRRKEHAPIDGEHEVADRGALPDEDLERMQLRQKVMDAIAGLPRKQRETVTLFYMNGYSVAEIASMEEAPVGSIKRRLHDARERLKEEMIDMVETTLKAEAPGEDFAKTVYDALNRDGKHLFEPTPHEWPPIVEMLRTGDTGSVEGILAALYSPNWRTRHTAAFMLREADVLPAPAAKRLVDLLEDPNQHVRVSSMAALMTAGEDKENRRERLMPTILGMLNDHATRVRIGVAEILVEEGLAGEVPLSLASAALSKETALLAIRRMQALVSAVLQAQGHGE